MRRISTDPGRWIGFTNDPAEVDGWCAWLRIGTAIEIYICGGDSR